MKAWRYWSAVEKPCRSEVLKPDKVFRRRSDQASTANTSAARRVETSQRRVRTCLVMRMGLSKYAKCHPMRSAPARTIGDILYNFHWVIPGEAARAMQAWAGGLGPFLKRRGIAAIINLRGRNDDLSWWKKETAIAKSAGIAHLDAMLDSRKLPTTDMLVQLIAAFDAAPRPFMLKCSGGQDRTSFAAALYLIHRDGWGAMP